MVSLDLIHASNARIKSLPPGLVAVFVGATNGVGETTVKQFAKHAVKPRVYITGRSQEAGVRIVKECKEFNREGSFVFIQRETSLMRNVDAICEEIKGKEEVVNVLFLSVGTLITGGKTAEGLNYPAALTIHGRNRFITNLLPQLQKATSLRRVVTVFSATFEGKIDKSDFQSWNLGRMANQAHFASITTLALEAHHEVAPGVSFIHNFPGAVESGIARGEIGWLMRVLKTIWGILGPLVHIPLEEAGDRHVFLCTSARFPAGPEDNAAGVPLVDGTSLAPGIDGKEGSGVYSISADAESATAKVQNLLAEYRKEGLVEWVRKNIESDVDMALSANVAE